MTERLVDFIKTIFETGKERIKNGFERLGFLVKYESIYGKSFEDSY